MPGFRLPAPTCTSKADRIAAELTEAQRRAMRSAYDHSDGSGAYLRSDVFRIVRRGLIERGLLSRRVTNPLTKLGREVRAVLLKSEA